MACFYTSEEVKNDNRGTHSYEVNYLSIIAMREIGRQGVITSLSALWWCYEFTPTNEHKSL